MEDLFFYTFSTLFNDITIVWKGKDPKLRLHRIFLSDSDEKSEEKALNHFTRIKTGSSQLIESLRDRIRGYFKGENVKFDLELINFTICTEIQEKVLRAEYQIPRGWVSTYKRIANHIGVYNGARAVGNALAKNPFPIIIPCHRAIKSNGELGKFQGGIVMKRKLLEMEGIEFSSRGKVITERIFY